MIEILSNNGPTITNMNIKKYLIIVKRYILYLYITNYRIYRIYETLLSLTRKHEDRRSGLLWIIIM